MSADGATACCMRVESDKPAHNGGWMHPTGAPPREPTRLPPPPPVRLTGEEVHRKWRRWWLQDTDHDTLAAGLGVTGPSLMRLGLAWAWPHEAWAFPMFDAQGEPCGLRLRNEAGDKWALKGSRQGIFIADAWIDPPADIVVVEGPTDAAAALDLGLYAIGRPSCTGGGPELATFCQRNGTKTLTICADNDGPGMAGAMALMASLRVKRRVVALPQKDVRAFVNAGGTADDFEQYAKESKWTT